MNVAPAARLAIVLSHPTQYYSPWFRWLAQHERVDLRVFYLWEFGVTPTRDPQFQVSFRWDTDLLSGYDHEFVPNTARDPGTHRFGGLRNPALPQRLAAWNPAALLLFGYKWASHLRAIAWARRRGVPLLLRGDSHFLGRRRPRFLQRTILRLLFRQFAALLPVGVANRDYYNVLGVPSHRLFFAPHAVDHALFDAQRQDHRAAAAQLRRQLGLDPARLVVLFAGKFVADKQPRELLAAFLGLSPPDASLVFVGDGPERTALVAAANAAGAQPVHFLPFANQSEMPARLLLANLFVLPSRGHYETWGLAVNEAMHLGVPALVSDRVGCQRDLVEPGATGWVFRHDNPADLRDQLGAALASLRRAGEAAALRDRVLTRISGYTYTQASAGLRAALEHVLAEQVRSSAPAA